MSTELGVTCLGQAEQEPPVRSARRAMLASPAVQNLMAELSGWPGTVISSHKSASQPFHKLTFLADLGLTANDPGVDTIVARILEHNRLRGLSSSQSTSPKIMVAPDRINGPGPYAMRR